MWKSAAEVGSTFNRSGVDSWVWAQRHPARHGLSSCGCLSGRAGGRRRPVAAARGAVLVLSRRGAARELCKFWKVYVACARRVDGVKGLWEISEGATVRCHRTRNARASQIDRRPRGVLTVVGRALEACIRVATRQLSTSFISCDRSRVVPAR